ALGRGAQDTVQPRLAVRRDEFGRPDLVRPGPNHALQLRLDPIDVVEIAVPNDRVVGGGADPLDASGRITSADHVAKANESIHAPPAGDALGLLERIEIAVKVRDEGPAGHGVGVGRASGRSPDRTGSGVSRDGIQTRVVKLVQPSARSSRMMRSLS